MKLRRSTAIACAMAGAFGMASNVSALTLDETFNGFYVETGDTSNRGINVQFFKLAPELWAGFVTGFTYDSAGNQLWFSGTDNQVRPGDTSIDFNINLANGGRPFGGNQVPSTAAVQGTGSLVFNTCNSVELNLTTDTTSPIPNVSDLSLDRGESLLGPIGVVGPDQCVFQQAFDGCPAFSDGLADSSIPGVPERACIISGTFTTDIVLTNDIFWIMNGPVFIGNAGGTGNSNSVTIEPGTRIVASGAAEREAFIVSRGAKIFANGVAHGPVVFSGLQAAADSSPGDFGGMVVNGAAPVNDCPANDCDGEGNSGQYGGDNVFDSSGIIKYTRIQFGGDSFNPEDQLNGLALQGTGAGTVIDFVQVHANSDDGIEFFGGTTRATHILLTENQDDSLDWTFGWQGSVQYIAVVQSDVGDQGIEADNNSGGFVLSPRSQPQIANGTFVGNSSTDIGFLLRAGTGVNITNSIVTGFGDGCIDIDDGPTFTQSIDGSGSANGTLTIANTLINCSTNFINEDGDDFSVSDFFSGNGNVTSDPGLNGLFPPNGAFYLEGLIMDASVFGNLDLVEYAGAFQSEATAWTAGWTEFLD